MSENVVSLSGVALSAVERKRQFMDDVAQSYEQYVEDYGEEPEAVVYVLGGEMQTVRAGWHVTGVSQQAIGTVLALSSVCLLKEQINPD